MNIKKKHAEAINHVLNEISFFGYNENLWPL